MHKRKAYTFMQNEFEPRFEFFAVSTPRDQFWPENDNNNKYKITKKNDFNHDLPFVWSIFQHFKIYILMSNYLEVKNKAKPLVL